MKGVIRAAKFGAAAILALSISLNAQDALTDAEAVRAQLEQVEHLRNRGEYDEGINLGIATMAAARDLNQPELEVEAHYQIALLYYFKDDFARARAEMEMGLARARVHEMEALEADFLSAAGVLEWKQGNLSLALPKLEAAMAIQERRGNRVSMASISNNLGIISYSLKNYEEAAEYYEVGLRTLGENDNGRLKASLYSNLAEVLIHGNQLREAELYLFKALAIETKLDEPHNTAYTYFNLGELYSKKGDREKAISLYNQALSIQQSIGVDWAISLTRLRLAEEYLLKGNSEVALEHVQLGHQLAKNLNALSLLRDYAELLANLYELNGEELRSSYHRSQYNWLEQRVREGDLVNPPIAATLQVAELPPNQELSPVQTGVIIILAILIIILIIENARLRHRSRT